MGNPIKHRQSWRIRWWDERGVRQSLTFDNRKDAAFELRQREIEVEEIKRGLKTPRVQDKKFADICDYWLEHRTPRKRNGREDKSIIGKLRENFAHVLLCDLGTMHVDAYKAKMQGRDNQTTNNHLKVLISLLNAAIELKWLSEKPRIKKFKIPKYNQDYRYLKTKDEISRLLIAARDESDLAYALYTFAIFTGMRQGEIAGLTKASVDFDKRLIMVARSFDGPTKNGGIRFLPILDPLLPVLQSWLLKHPGTLVFPNEVGRMHQRSARIFQETLHRVIQEAAFPLVKIKGKERRYIRFHDLRHTFASHWMMDGGDLFRLQKILGHSSPEMTMRYAHLTPMAAG